MNWSWPGKPGNVLTERATTAEKRLKAIKGVRYIAIVYTTVVAVCSKLQSKM